MANTIVITKTQEDVVLVNNDGREYTLKSDYRVQKKGGNVEILTDLGGLIQVFNPVEVEKVVLKDTSEVFISDQDTLFTQLITNFFFVSVESISNGVSSENFISVYTVNTQSISIANTFQPVTFENEVAKDGWTHSTTVNPEDFTCTTTGIYRINIHGTAQKTSGANALFELRVTLDGVEVTGSAFGTDVVTNNELKNVGSNLIFSATTGQILNIEITAGITTAEISAPSGNAITHVSLKFGISRIK